MIHYGQHEKSFEICHGCIVDITRVSQSCLYWIINLCARPSAILLSVPTKYYLWIQTETQLYSIFSNRKQGIRSIYGFLIVPSGNNLDQMNNIPILRHHWFLRSENIQFSTPKFLPQNRNEALFHLEKSQPLEITLISFGGHR